MFIMKLYIKMLMQHILLPIIYRVACIQPINNTYIIFADSHHSSMPYSMEELYKAFQPTDYTIQCMFHDMEQNGTCSSLLFMMKFMVRYARAKHIIICDNFLPVASCKKRTGTHVTQLWHGAGVLKKFGYDTERDIPKNYLGNVFRNYDLITVSSPYCIPFYQSAMKANDGVVQSLGISRSDRYYSQMYIEQCKNEYFQMNPSHIGKKLLLWAPTFRGNASSMEPMDLSDMLSLQNKLGSKWIVIMKLHPHMEKVKEYQQYVSTTLPSERLLPVIDLLVTDYSSILFEYLLLRKPLVLHIPTFEFEQINNELYTDLYEIPAMITSTSDELLHAVSDTYCHYNNHPCAEQYEVQHKDKFDAFQLKYMESCDGHATDRIMEYFLGVT